MKSLLLSLSFVSVFWFMAGCATGGRYAAFVKDVTFSDLQAFEYRETVCEGARWKESQQVLLDQVSAEIVVETLKAQGFEQALQLPDFYVVVRWQKSVTMVPEAADSFKGVHQSIGNAGDATGGLAPRCHLRVEFYERSTGQLFWLKELTNVFDAIDFTEERVRYALDEALKDFPKRIERDPNLPDLQQEIVNH